MPASSLPLLAYTLVPPPPACRPSLALCEAGTSKPCFQDQQEWDNENTMSFRELPMGSNAKMLTRCEPKWREAAALEPGCPGFHSCLSYCVTSGK